MAQQLRDAVVRRTVEIMKQHPGMGRASAAQMAAYEILEPVEKSQGEMTLAQFVDARLSALTATRVSKGLDATWAASAAEVAKAHPALVNVRSCGVASLPFAEAVAEIRKSLRDSKDWGEQQIMQSWLEAIGR